MSESIEHKNPWRELWVKWFDFHGEPWEQLTDGETWCFFCGDRGSHNPDCVYLKVKRLLDEEAE